MVRGGGTVTQRCCAPRAVGAEAVLPAMGREGLRWAELRGNLLGWEVGVGKLLSRRREG